MSVGMLQNNSSTTMLLNELKNSPVQYKPLNKQQEKELIEKYKDDRTRLNQLLYMHNIRLVFNMAKKYATKTQDFDSLVSDCLYGLAVACSKFDLDRNIKFSTYATQWIFKYCLSGFYDKTNQIASKSISLNSPILASSAKSNNGNEATVENFINNSIDQSVTNCKSTREQLSSNELSGIYKTIMAKIDEDTSISSLEKNVFLDTMYAQEKPKAVASKYDVTVKYVKETKNKLINKFKEILASDYDIHSEVDLNF